MRVLAVAYAAACLFALLLIPAGAFGWFGVTADPVAGVPAYVLGLPWTLLAAQMDADPDVTWAVLLTAAAMSLNLAIVVEVGRKLVRTRIRLRPRRG